MLPTYLCNTHAKQIISLNIHIANLSANFDQLEYFGIYFFNYKLFYALKWL